MSSIFLGGSAPAPLIEIRRDGKSMVTVHPDGRVEYHGEYAPDEAARAFWEALSTFCPTRQYAEALAALSAEKEKRQAAQGGVTEAMVERARLAIMASNGFEPGSDGYINDSAIRAALEAAISAEPAAQGEAEYDVGWKIRGVTAYDEAKRKGYRHPECVEAAIKAAPPAQPAEVDDDPMLAAIERLRLALGELSPDADALTIIATAETRVRRLSAQPAERVPEVSDAPTPWSYRRMNRHFAIEAANGVRVAEVRYVARPDGTTSEAQAKAIVNAVNEATPAAPADGDGKEGSRG